ncbi:hypothetical protein MMC22_008375 [Lobaria immixta]|nr:hypothetical protein [Lobaria immixta]
MPSTFIKRPISPLNSEPLIPLPEDILCFGSDEEETAGEHRDKRRRIEIQGQQYLEGRPLFILSASLRGPLNEAWVNPWSRKRQGNGDLNKRRVPATPTEVINAPSWMRNAESRLDQQGEDYNAVTHLRQDPQELSLKPSDFQNLSKRDPAETTKTHQSPRKWLKSDNVYFRERVRKSSRSPTPTPNTKHRDQALAISNTPVRPPTKIQPNPQTAPNVPGEPLSKSTYNFGFTPVNKRASPQNTEIQVAHGQAHQAKPPEAKVDSEEFLYPSKVTVREITLDEADEPIRRGHYRVKKLSQEAVEEAVTTDGLNQARNLSERAASRALECSLRADGSHVKSRGSSDSIGQDALAAVAQAKDMGFLEDSLQALPPSTNLPEFNYRYARKHNPLPPKERPSFAETLEIAKAQAEILEIANAKAKAKAQEQEIRRLSFTASGNVKNSKSTSRKRSQHRTSSPLQQRRTSSREPKQTVQGHSSTAGKGSLATVASPRLTMSGGLSYENDDQPEAQIVPPVPVVSGLVTSGPSTDMLETDRQPLNPQSIEEGDSYADLSTQAAILKAQRSFQNGVFSPAKISSPRKQNEAARSVVSPSAHKITKASDIAHQPFREPSPTSPKPSASENHDDEPMDTQAMVDAMSPFAITTVKKRKKDTNIALSPTSPTANLVPAHSLPTSGTFANAPSPSFPISHTHSKPSSFGLTSFSIAPNSTLTDVFQQDGQQQQPQPRYFDTSGLDLDAAIEEAGQFLGSWDVESEARKEGVRGSADSGGKDKSEDSRGKKGGGGMRKETRLGVVEG